MGAKRGDVRQTLLSVSPDPRLLISRTQVLRSAGYEVIAAIDRHVAVIAAANRSVDLAILCHAFSEDESESIEHDLRMVHPGVVVLQLQQVRGLKSKGQSLDPDVLLQKVRDALSGREV